MEGGKFVYLYWKVDVITADHDGWCSGDENYEEIRSDVLCCSYFISLKERQWLKELCSILNFVDMFNELDLVPYIPNDDIGITGGGSGYCRVSEHGLCHERKRIPIKVVDFSFRAPNGGEVDVVPVNSNLLRKYLRNVRDINHAIDQVFRESAFPRDMIKMICQYVWNK